MDWNSILTEAAKSGVFAALFTMLLWYVLKDGREREKKYQETISALSDSLKAVEEIGYNVKIIVKRMEKLGVNYGK